MQASLRRMWIGLLCLAICTIAAGSAMAQSDNPAGKLSEAQVREELKKISPQVKEEKIARTDGRSTTLFFVELSRDGLRAPAYVEVQETVVFVNITLGRLKPATDLSGEQLTRLLQTQLRIGPSYFSVIDGPGGLYLRMSHRMDAAGSVQRFHAMLDEVLGDVSSAMPLWMDLIRKPSK